MKRSRSLVLCALGLALVGGSVRAGDSVIPPYGGPGGTFPNRPGWCPAPGFPAQVMPPADGQPSMQPGTQPSVQPGEQPGAQPGAQPDAAAANDAFAQAAPAGGDVPGSFNPQMIGDLGAGGFATLSHPSGFTTTRIVTMQGSTPVATILRSPVSRTIRIPLVGRTGFKISENESPRPVDRAFITYNYFSNVGSGGGVPLFDVHRELAGFEKTFLDGDASIGMRLPFLQQPGSSVGRADIGDLSIILKYAFVNDRETGNVLTGGLVVTAPTAGSRLNTLGGNQDTTLIQPYTGYIYNMDRLFVQGFSSLIFPTDASNPTLMSNDLGVGYKLLQGDCDSMLRYVIPTLEGHLTTPLSKRGLNATPVGFPDTFVMTAGVHLGVFNGANLTLGVAEPFTGPKPFDVEGIIQFNYRF